MKLIALTTAFLFFASGCFAQSSSEPVANRDAIIEKLSRGVKARKIDVDEIRNSVKNRISVEAAPALGQPNKDGASTSILTQDLPAISFQILFDYGSATLNPQSLPTLIQLGQALKDDRLFKYRFLVAGHTDAAGSREFNRLLSERRAGAVRTFLVASFGIPANRLAPVGFGMEQLKDAENPLSGLNRRVEIINIGE